MTRTGPQKIPGANQSNFYGTGQFSGSGMEVNCGVAHTTEGRTLPTYADSQGRRGAVAPTVTGLPDFKAKKIRWYQHYDVDESARALMNKLGGVETNTANVFQIELVGTCDPKTRDSWVRSGYKQDVDFIYWPDAPDWALAEVAWLVRWLHDQHNVPLTCVKDWLAYGADSRRPGVTPASYGSNPARMSMAQWRSFTGWCGHQHVPENDHGDPGSMDFARVIALAKGSTTTPSEEDDMTPEQSRKLDALYDLLTPYAGWDYKGKGKAADAYSYLIGTDARTVEILAAVTKLGSAGLSAAQIQAAAEAGANAALKALADRLTP